MYQIVSSTSYILLFILLHSYYTYAQVDGSISFATNFEGGNIGEVEKVSEHNYTIHLKGESDWQNRNRQVSWYYFKITGAKDQDLNLKLTDLVGEYNFRPGTHAITKDTRPVFSYDQHTWQHLDEHQIIWDEDQKELTLRIKPEQHQVWIAHQPPYTNQDLNETLLRYISNPKLKIDTIGFTPEKRPMLLLTIGQSTNDLKKKVIWLMARQHSWESGTSWLMESVLHYLLDSNINEEWMTGYIFKIYPLADPDGVARGGVRFNQFGHDLNRNWDKVNEAEMPEIFQQKEAIRSWLNAGNKIDFFLTLHNTEANDYLQGPELMEGQNFWQNMQEQSSFSAPEGLRKIRLDIDPGRMTVYENLWYEFKVPAYLMELKVEQADKLNRSRNVEDWKALGPGLIRSIVSALSN